VGIWVRAQQPVESHTVPSLASLNEECAPPPCIQGDAIVMRSLMRFDDERRCDTHARGSQSRVHFELG
jgi:hypothetical protein